jgi:hypothetical protein
MKHGWSLSFSIALAALLAVEKPAAAGLYVEQTVNTTGQGQGMDLDVRASVDGDSARVEYVTSNNPAMPPGSYLLTNDGGQTVYLVNPEQRTYSRFDMNEIFAMVGSMTEATGGMVQMDFRDPESESLGSEPGGAILGYDTEKRSWRSAYTIDMKVAFMDQSNRMETVTEAWVTDEIDIPALGVWFKAQPPTTGDPELDEVLTSAMEQAGGVPLKMRQDSTTTDKRGRTTSSTTVMEVTTLREEPVDAGLFAMPEGYTEAPLIPGMAAMQGQAGDKGNENPMDALKGLFGRKTKDDG